MRRRMCWTAVVGTCAWLLLARPAEALITRPTPLQDLLSDSTWIVTAKVESLDETRPAMMLALDEELKGKVPGKKMPVLLKGDRRAERGKETPQLLKRLAVKLPVVVFGNKREDFNAAIVYSNGTWFSLTGTLVEGELRWSFTHLEPFLRRTYAGTTAEMVQTLRDAISGKRKPPAVNNKEKEGIGPEVKKTSTSATPGSEDSTRGFTTPPPARGSGGVAAALLNPLWVAASKAPGGAVSSERNPRAAPGAALAGPFIPWQESRRAVIPTVLVGGPLAMLAMLFPAVFGGWRRWFVLLSTAGTISTLYFCQWWFADSLTGLWASPVALWTLITATAVLGLGWAWSRHLFRVQTGEAPLLAGGVELAVLAVVSLIGLATLSYCRLAQQPLLSQNWLPVVAFTLSVWIGTAYVAWTKLRGPRLMPALATETVVLTALAVVCVALTPALSGRSTAGGLEAGEQAGAGKASAELVWTFRLPERGSIASSPLVVGDRVFVAAAHDDVFRPWGALYCLDRATGKVLWTFHDGKKMKQVFSSPVVSGNRLYIGEGFHQDFDCKLYCLETARGRKLWEFQTGSHTEATPTLDGGKVYIGSGDDGLYCLDARTGEKRWNFPGFHIDAGAALDSDRLFVGSGLGDVYKTTALFCLDGDKGQPKWRVATDLPVWCRPIVSGGFVYAGSGNGRLNESDDNPAGCVYCLRAKDGNEVWKRKLPDGVLGRLGADRQRLYVGCRDGSFYCLSRRDGSQVWRRDLGSPVVAGPALDVGPGLESLASRVYAASTGGQLVCLEPGTGEVVWGKDLVGDARVPVEVIATPALELGYDEAGREVRRLYVGLTRAGAARFGELHCYEEKGE